MLYTFDIGGKIVTKIVTDTTFNVRVLKTVLENITIYDEYIIRDGETPEIISDKVYGTPLYHWVLMLINQRFDYYKDFPMSYDNLLNYVQSKYGFGNENLIHHYEDVNGFVINSDTPRAIPVSNMDYEDKLNEEKRTLKIVDKAVIQQLLNEFENLTNL